MLGEATLDVLGTFLGEAIRLLILFAAPHRAPVRGDPMCRKAWQASVTWPNASSAVGIREIRYNVCGLLPTSTQVEPRTRPTQGNGR